MLGKAQSLQFNHFLKTFFCVFSASKKRLPFFKNFPHKNSKISELFSKSTECPFFETRLSKSRFGRFSVHPAHFPAKIRKYFFPLWSREQEKRWSFLALFVLISTKLDCGATRHGEAVRPQHLCAKRRAKRVQGRVREAREDPREAHRHGTGALRSRWQ